MEVEQTINIEQTITRRPKRLYELVVEWNEKSGEFCPLVEDGENRKEVKGLCILFSRKMINFHDFMWHLRNMDLFLHADLGPLLENFQLAPIDARLRLPKEELDKVYSEPGWGRVFA